MSVTLELLTAWLYTRISFHANNHGANAREVTNAGFNGLQYAATTESVVKMLHTNSPPAAISLSPISNTRSFIIVSSVVSNCVCILAALNGVHIVKIRAFLTEPHFLSRVERRVSEINILTSILFIRYVFLWNLLWIMSNSVLNLLLPRARSVFSVGTDNLIFYDFKRAEVPQIWISLTTSSFSKHGFSNRNLRR